jgi:hypothetical protein
MGLNELVTAVSGSAGAVVVCLLVMYYGYKLIVEKVLPHQSEMIHDILEEHRKDRKVFVDSIVLMDKRLTSVEDDLTDIKHLIEEIK